MKPLKKVLVAKPGLDGHDLGARMICRLLKDAGFEVVYTGLRQSLDQIVSAALQEDVDIVGLSILSGAHMELTEKFLKKMKEAGLDHVPVVVGGVILAEDVEALKTMGVREVFPSYTPLEEIVEGFRRLAGEAGNGPRTT